MSERFTPNAASHALVMKDGKVLMIRRFNTGWMDGMYTTPTGHIEKGESAAEAAARELYEETGLVTDPMKLRHVITVHRQNELKGVYFDNYFVADEWSGEATIAEPEKCDDIAWRPLSNLGNDIVPSVLRALTACQSGKTYMEEGWDN